MPFMAMQHDEDPAKKILEKIGMKKLGELPGFRLHGNRVLVGIYERPEKMKAIKTASGDSVSLVLPDQVRKEDEHQGKAGLVLMKGATAFVDDDHFSFHGDDVEPGEWISLWVTDGRKININGQLCRIVRDQDINMVIPSPDSVF